MERANQSRFTDETGERDAGWVQSALAGNKEAFGYLVKAYERPAASTAYRLLGNSHDAVEVVQEALLRAYRSLDRLADPSRFGPWLLRIVSNLSLNARRSRRFGSAVTLDEQRGTDGVTSGDGPPLVSSRSPDYEVQRRELNEALEAALEALPDKQRLALVLFTIEGWAQKDIAEVLQCSVENVKWHVFQARKKLREQLGDHLAG